LTKIREPGQSKKNSTDNGDAQENEKSERALSELAREGGNKGIFRSRVTQFGGNEAG